MNRTDKILKHIDKSGKGMEIGPSYSPIAPKNQGYDVDVMDHLDQQQLREKYQGYGVDLDAIEVVDYVWNGECFRELTGNRYRYDWVIASHLIEHTPDLIGFLNNCESILSERGVLSLVVPDKRYCFDRFRPISNLAYVIDSHLRQEKIHSPGTVAEFYLNIVSKNDIIAWHENCEGSYRFIHSYDDALFNINDVIENEKYIDVHRWCFVPQSFRLLIHDLNKLGFISLCELDFDGTVGCEFYMTLQKGKAPVDLDRLQLMQEIDSEIASPVLSKANEMSDKKAKEATININKSSLQRLRSKLRRLI